MAYLSPPISPPISTLLPAAIAVLAIACKRREGTAPRSYRASVIVERALARHFRACGKITRGYFFAGECERPSAKLGQSNRVAAPPLRRRRERTTAIPSASPGHASRPPLRPAFRRARCVKRAKFPFRVAHPDGRIIRARIPQWSRCARTSAASFSPLYLRSSRSAPSCTRASRVARGRCN